MKLFRISVIIRVIIIAVVVGVLAYNYSQIYIGLQNPLWVSIFVTVILVGINAYYAWQVNKTIDEMKKATRAQFRPHIRTHLIFLNRFNLILKITNFGKGPATKIKAQITFLPKGETRLWEQSIMSPNESIYVQLPDGDRDRACETSAKIIEKGKYEDIFNQVFPIFDEINTKEIIEQTMQLKPVFDENLTTLFIRLESKLEEIKKELSYIRQNIGRKLEK